MPTPKKGRRLGGSSSHQRSMMANLAASLFAAEAIETTEAKAKALRPYAEKLITKAKSERWFKQPSPSPSTRLEPKRRPRDGSETCR